jgi:hypothetical protein
VSGAQVDHLVIAARTLDEGDAWCEAIFGITPGPGGRHPLMGTHNRVFAIGSTAHPRAYLEIIAIDPAARAPGRRRWFDLDQPRLRAAVAREPRLVHFVARCEHGGDALEALRATGADAGEFVAAERDTPSGTLRWRLTLREDGGRPGDGTVPALIEWSGAHPADSLGASGVTLRALSAVHPDVHRLQQAWRAIGLREAAAHEGAVDLVATFDSPRGTVTLHSDGA